MTELLLPPGYLLLGPLTDGRAVLGGLPNAVGADAGNRRPDVAKVETFLDRAGHRPGETEGPIGYYESRVDQGILSFQKDNALEIEGLINPDGETLERLGALLSDESRHCSRPDRLLCSGRH